MSRSRSPSVVGLSLDSTRNYGGTTPIPDNRRRGLMPCERGADTFKEIQSFTITSGSNARLICHIIKASA
jgi:hypothetical protein